MAKIFTLNKLSAEFYRDFGGDTYPEIEQKPSRPYVVMIIMIGENRFALPFRTHIKHDQCYKFRRSGRTTDSVTGIDFSKAVIVNDSQYIGEPATIDNSEYVELQRKFYFIAKKFQNYLNGYIRFRLNGGNPLTDAKFRYSTLRYFEKELGIL